MQRSISLKKTNIKQIISFESVDKFKMITYNISTGLKIMKFKIDKLKQAEKEISKLSKEQQEALQNDFETIESKGLEFVKRRHLREGIFEIKTNDIRSLFKYLDDKIILIGLVYEKRSNKSPDYYIKLAKTRLKEV